MFLPRLVTLVTLVTLVSHSQLQWRGLHKAGWTPSFRSGSAPTCADTRTMRCLPCKNAPQQDPNLSGTL